TRRRVLAFFAVVILLLLVIVGGLVLYINSPVFEEQARRYIIRQIETNTGASVTLRHFEWSLSGQLFRLDDLVIRGLGPSSVPPLASIPRIEIGVNLGSLLQRKLNLFVLNVDQPEFHILVDEKGKTNFPSPPPRGPRKSFDFEISIENFRVLQ